LCTVCDEGFFKYPKEAGPELKNNFRRCFQEPTTDSTVITGETYLASGSGNYDMADAPKFPVHEIFPDSRLQFAARRERLLEEDGGDPSADPNLTRFFCNPTRFFFFIFWLIRPFEFFDFFFK